MQEELNTLELNPDNSVVIGSGILNALGIRDSNDIDLVVDQETYARLRSSNQFQIGESYGKEVLIDDVFEISLYWEVLGKQYSFDDFLEESVVIDGVRYCKLDFLLRVKKSWISNDESPRPKDINDVKLIEDYLLQNSE